MERHPFAQIKPQDIERRSFEILTAELGGRRLNPDNAPVIKRVIHTTADFDYADSLCFSDRAVPDAVRRLKKGGVTLVTDTQMALAGINKPTLEKLGCSARCFMADADVAETAARRGVTRAAAAADKAAATLSGDLIFAVGNAPTALARVCELIDRGELSPSLVIGAPVGFVNVVESKELALRLSVPFIVARGRKGGSNVAAAIVNALLYLAAGRAV
jgi:precorrin-8X/cobalt-precorrin-8 methylmutase